MFPRKEESMPAPRPPSPPPPFRDYAVVVLICTFFALVPWTPACFSARSERVEVPRAAQVDEAPPTAWVTDGADAGAGAARPLPKKSFPGQKAPPCAKGQVEVVGGCWEALKRGPVAGSCGPDAFEHDNECLVPVKKATPVPNAVQP
jgi:hypothetical protein